MDARAQEGEATQPIRNGGKHTGTEWEYFIFWTLQEEEGEGATIFFNGLDIGDFFEVRKAGAGTFLNIKTTESEFVNRKALHICRH